MAVIKDRERLANLMKMALAAPTEGERLNALSLMRKALAASGASEHDVADLILNGRGGTGDVRIIEKVVTREVEVVKWREKIVERPVIIYRDRVIRVPVEVPVKAPDPPPPAEVAAPEPKPKKYDPKVERFPVDYMEIKEELAILKNKRLSAEDRQFVEFLDGKMDQYKAFAHMTPKQRRYLDAIKSRAAA